MNQLFTAVFVFMVTCKIARGNPLFNLYGYAILEEPPDGFHYESQLTLPYDRNTYKIMPMRDVFSVMASRLGMTGNARSKRSFFSSLWSDEQEEKTVMDKTSSAQLQADDDSDEGYLDRIGSAIVDVGEDVESCLVTAAPYLPLVTKVALFVVPGLREYQMLVMALNVASITSNAYKRYDDGEGLTTVATSAAWQMFTLKKRSDPELTFKEYAQNMYDSLKQSLASRFSSRLFHSESAADDETTTTDVTAAAGVVGKIDKTAVGLLGTGNGVQTIKTTVTNGYNINGVKIPEVQTTVTKYVKNGVDNNIMAMNNGISAGGGITQSAADCSPTTDTASGKVKYLEMSDKLKIVRELRKTIGQKKKTLIDVGQISEASDESEEEVVILNENDVLNADKKIEVDKSLFYKYLNESMSLQPEFIQNKSGEELVQFLDRIDIKLPNNLLAIDSSKIFYVLISTMDFEDDVTDEQIKRLVDVLNKITNYFIDSAIRTKQRSTKQDTN